MTLPLNTLLLIVTWFGCACTGMAEPYGERVSYWSANQLAREISLEQPCVILRVAWDDDQGYVDQIPSLTKRVYSFH